MLSLQAVCAVLTLVAIIDAIAGAAGETTAPVEILSATILAVTFVSSCTHPVNYTSLNFLFV